MKLKVFKTFSDGMITALAGIITTALVALVFQQRCSTEEIVKSQRTHFNKYMNQGKWEYKIIVEDFIPRQKYSSNILNKLGNNGWELLETFPDSNPKKIVMILKRKSRIK